MLRNLFLFLLLANIVLFAWQRWIVPPEVADPRAATGLPDAGLTLAVAPAGPEQRPAPPAVSPAPDAPPTEMVPATGPEPLPQPSPPVLDTVVCRQVGPFDSAERAESAASRLRADGIEARPIGREGKVWVGHWVQVDGLPDRAVAEAAIDALIGAGIVDAYIVSATPAYKVSLGVFRGREGADQAMRAARRAGLQPVTIDRFRTGTEYWLLARPMPGQRLDMDVLGGQPGRILRSETADCGADSDGSLGGVSLE